MIFWDVMHVYMYVRYVRSLAAVGGCFQSNPVIWHPHYVCAAVLMPTNLLDRFSSGRFKG